MGCSNDTECYVELPVTWTGQGTLPRLAGTGACQACQGSSAPVHRCGQQSPCPSLSSTVIQLEQLYFFYFY